VTVVRMPTAGPALFSAFVRDVSERKRAEEALRTSEERLRLLAEGSTDIVYRYLFRPRRGFDYVSPAAAKLTGYTVEEHYADPDIGSKLIHPADRKRFQSQLLTSTLGEPMDFRCVRKDGRVVTIEHRNTPLYDERGAMVGVQGIARDVTERRRSESEQRFLAEIGMVLARTLDVGDTLRSVADLVVTFYGGFCIIDLLDEGMRLRRLKVAYAEPGMAPIAELLQRVQLDPLRPQPIARVVESRCGTLDLEDAVEPTSERRAQLRSLQALSCMSLPMLARGHLLGVLGIVSSDPSRRFVPRDLALGEEIAVRAATAVDNAQLYRRAQRAVEGRDEVLRIVAHDLRNPLSVATLALDGVLSRLPEGDPSSPLRKAGRAIERSLNRANRLIDDLLDVARIQAGQLLIERKLTTPRDLINDASEAFTAMASGASLQLATAVADELPPVFVDGERIVQVFSNLIGNAIKFASTGGVVRLGATQEDGEVRFSVADSGPGIPPAQMEHLFDHFWQAHPGDRRGVGLGLTIAKGIVESHGGRIWAESTPGRGTTFFFTLPVRSTADAHAASRTAAERPSV
jgi:PAS domain S-box-containing protein